MRRVIVTGANGFVGSAVCKVLSDANVETIAVVRSEKSDVSRLSKLSNVKIVNCDLKSIAKLPDIWDCENVDAFFHFAWEGSAGPLRGDINTQIENIQFSLDVLDVCNKLGCKRLIYAASIMEYEVSAAIEKGNRLPINSIYSVAKLSCDYMLSIKANSLGIEYMRCIISNIYGPGEISSRLINTSIRKILNHEHCSFSSGEQMYDFVYITDAAQMFYGVGERGIGGRTYYIGSEKPRKLKDFLLEMGSVVDKDCDIGFGEIPFEGVSLNYDEFDIHTLKNDIGYVPKVSFREGIYNTMEWMKGNK